MSDKKHTIHYNLIADVCFNSATVMKKHLESEKTIWSPFLEHIQQHKHLESIQFQQGGGTNSGQLATAFDRLLERIDDVNKFNQSTQTYRKDVLLPPPSTEVEGQLILGLFENNRYFDSVSVYLWFLNNDTAFQQGGNRAIPELLTRG